MTTSNITTALAERVDKEELDDAIAPTAREVAISRIQLETHCRRSRAEGCIDFITDMLGKARSGERECGEVGVYHLKPSDMAKPGSAHEAVEALLLGPDEFGLVHSNPTGHKDDCVVKFGTRKAI